MDGGPRPKRTTPTIRPLRLTHSPLHQNDLLRRLRGSFGCKIWHSNTKYERRIWRCNNKYGHVKTPCATPHVTDIDVEQAFVEALSERVKSNTGARNVLEILEATVFDTSELEPQRDRAAQQVEEIIVLIDQMVLTAAQTAIDPNEYDQKYAELEARYNQPALSALILNHRSLTSKHASNKHTQSATSSNLSRPSNTATIHGRYSSTMQR